ncbi:MAG: hypothetical protein HPKKFMNG_02931 [Planctomycetes bacterium]|nr:hypothetical protein [Planctomycetota bacterium]
MSLLKTWYLWDSKIDDEVDTVLGSIVLNRHFPSERAEADAKFALSKRLANGDAPKDFCCEIVAVRGGSFHQVVWLQTDPAFLIHRDMLRAIEDAGLTGYSTFKVAFRIPMHGVVRKYRTTDFVGFGAREGPEKDDDALPIELRPAPVPKGKPYRVRVGFAVKANESDLPDVFRPRGTNYFVMSRRFKEVIETFDIANTVIEPTATYESWIWR